MTHVYSQNSLELEGIHKDQQVQLIRKWSVWESGIKHTLQGQNSTLWLSLFAADIFKTLN